MAKFADLKLTNNHVSEVNLGFYRSKVEKPLASPVGKVIFMAVSMCV